MPYVTLLLCLVQPLLIHLLVNLRIIKIRNRLNEMLTIFLQIGKFRTIFYISLVYALGQVTLTIAAIGDDEDGNDGLHGLPAE